MNIIRVISYGGFISKAFASKTKRWLQKTIGNHAQIEITQASEAAELNLQNTVAIVVPGGNTSDYIQGLGEQGLQNIKNFVANGGHYIGLCGGAYLASTQMNFTGENFVITRKKDNTDLLALAPVKAQGSLPELTGGRLYSGNLNSAAAANISFREKKFCHIYYNGGPKFIIDDQAAQGSFEILAKYAEFDSIAAIRYNASSGGVVTLSGVHPELSLELNCLLSQDDTKPLINNSKTIMDFSKILLSPFMKCFLGKKPKTAFCNSFSQLLASQGFQESPQILAA